MNQKKQQKHALDCKIGDTIHKNIISFNHRTLQLLVQKFDSDFKQKVSSTHMATKIYGQRIQVWMIQMSPYKAKNL